MVITKFDMVIELFDLAIEFFAVLIEAVATVMQQSSISPVFSNRAHFVTVPNVGLLVI